MNFGHTWAVDKNFQDFCESSYDIFTFQPVLADLISAEAISQIKESTKV